MHKKVFPARPSHLVTLGLSAAMLTPTLLAGCGGQSSQTSTLPQAPPVANNGRMMSSGTQQQGMSTKKKVVLVAGAALLYYLYKRHENAKAAAGNDANGQYFVSKSNGRVYYRFLSGPNKGKFQYVSPPAPMNLPESAAQQYGLQNYQGYRGASNGREFGGYGASNQGSYNDAVPGADIS